MRQADIQMKFVQQREFGCLNLAFLFPKRTVAPGCYTCSGVRITL